MKVQSMEVLQNGFNKAMKSFKVKANAKGKVGDYYVILDLYAPQFESLGGVMQDNDQEPKDG